MQCSDQPLGRDGTVADRRSVRRAAAGAGASSASSTWANQADSRSIKTVPRRGVVRLEDVGLLFQPGEEPRQQGAHPGEHLTAQVSRQVHSVRPRRVAHTQIARAKRLGSPHMLEPQPAAEHQRQEGHLRIGLPHRFSVRRNPVGRCDVGHANTGPSSSSLCRAQKSSVN
ncbi:hypothetical protein [Streptomyces canus]|uniref:hypothetical protein n=1 Tax=Streptomyces canus TaxID=58343 RepID=UPI0027D927D0|nr:hypothetical protein [Streptomyces canus]